MKVKTRGYKINVWLLGTCNFVLPSITLKSYYKLVSGEVAQI